MKTETLAPAIPVLERDGGKMPVLGLGTWELTGAACRRTVAAALDMGYRHLDTARAYKNEEDVGAGIRDSGVPREDLFLTTKLFMDGLDPERTRVSCEKSLDLLGTSYLDLLLIHWPEPELPIPGILHMLAELREEGKIRHLGVSNFTVSLMDQSVAAVDVPVFCNQVACHPYVDQSAVLNACRRHGILFVAYSPLARGRIASDKVLIKIARKYGKSPAQVVLRWLLSQRMAVIPKGSSDAHLRENLDVFNFEISREDADAIASLKKTEESL